MSKPELLLVYISAESQGVARQIGRVLVEERRWIGEERFLHALNYCMLLPGPEAQQLAIYIGWLLHKTKGGLVAGALFVLPGLVEPSGMHARCSSTSVMPVSHIQVTHFGQCAVERGNLLRLINHPQRVRDSLSADQINDSDVLMVNGASAALLCSDIPWNGPIAGIRLGRVAGQFVVNPTHEQQYESDLDLIYVGNETDMMMIEGSADQLPEADFIAALEYAQKAIQPIIAAQRKLAAMYSKTKRVFPLVVCEPKALAICERVAAEGDQLKKAIFLASKKERGDAVKAVVEKSKAACKAELGDVFDSRQIKMAFEKLQEKVYRNAIIQSGERADGRKPLDLRAISCEVDVLPRVHGSWAACCHCRSPAGTVGGRHLGRCGGGSIPPLVP
jgi:hypothetical protein